MIFSTKCIKWCFVVFNFLLVALTVYRLGEAVYLTITIAFEPKFIGDIFFLVVTFAIAFLGCFGAKKENPNVLMLYFLSLVIIFVIEFFFGLAKVVVLTEKAHTRHVDSYLSDFDNYWTEYSARSHIDYMQSHELCCGSTGPSYWEKFTDKTIPWSCCGTDESVTCNKTTAFTTGCVAILHSRFYRHRAHFTGIHAGLLAAYFVCFGFAVILADSFRKDHLRRMIYSVRNGLN